MTLIRCCCFQSQSIEDVLENIRNNYHSIYTIISPNIALLYRNKVYLPNANIAHSNVLFLNENAHSFRVKNKLHMGSKSIIRQFELMLYKLSYFSLYKYTLNWFLKNGVMLDFWAST